VIAAGPKRRTVFGVASAAILVLSLVAFPMPAQGAPAWSIVTSPNPSASTGSHLNAATCVNAKNCVAVGYFSTASSKGRLLVERWNGAKWAIVTVPSPTGSTGGYLNGVVCTSATFCTAVGYITTATSPGRPLVERWNGTKWSVVVPPGAPGATGSYLNAVSCMGPKSCVAVGYSYNSVSTNTFAERWNGTKWSVAPSPNPAGDSRDLQAVSCTTSANCLAVGFYTATSGSDSTFAERWNGSKWSIVTTANPKNSDSYLNGVSCPSPSSCMAVGATYGTTGPGRTLVERWNGSGWTILASPNPPGSGDSYLNDVRCPSATYCVAVGADAMSPDSTQAQVWNGSTWTVVPTPNPAGSAGSYLNSLGCASATICNAVGDWHGAGASVPLIEQYS
jgi:hypothetical protein